MYNIKSFWLLRILWFLFCSSLLCLIAYLGIYFFFEAASEPILPSWYLEHIPEEENLKLPVCNGYSTEILKFFGNGQFCPDGYGIFSQDNFGGHKSKSGGQTVPVIGPCCPLPFDDILTDIHQHNVEETCPENYIATGGSQSSSCGSSCYMRCTKINTEKYSLGPLKESYYWVNPIYEASSGRGSAKKIYLAQIPLAIRFSIGRTHLNGWNSDGCVGAPFGSLLVKKKSSSCDGYFYRELRFKNGSPIKMFAKCKAISGIYSEHAQCVP